MKHLAIGAILLIIGLSIVSPLEEILLLAPLSVSTGLPLVEIFTLIAILCLIGAVYFLGKSFVLGPLHQHIKWLVASVIVLAAYFAWVYVI